MPVPTAERFALLRTRMADTGTDLVALAPGAHMDWLLGFHPHPDERPCLLLVGAKSEAFLMPALNAEGSREMSDIAFHEWADEDGPGRALEAALAATQTGTARAVSIDETMRADFALLLLDNLPNARRDFTEATVGALRMRKDDTEYRLLKQNALINDRAMQAGFESLRPGISELDVAAAIRAHFGSEGAQPIFSIIGSGPNGAFPHHATGERTLEIGDAVVIDIGGRKDGFPSDMTRMAAIGHPHKAIKRFMPSSKTQFGPRLPPQGLACLPSRSMRRHAASSPMPVTANSSFTARATVLASRSTNRPISPRHPKRFSMKAWCFRSNRASTFRAVSEFAWRKSSSCDLTVLRSSPNCLAICTLRKLE